jgi:hypothetical protein
VKPTSPVGEDGDDAKDNNVANIPNQNLDLNDKDGTKIADEGE